MGLMDEIASSTYDPEATTVISRTETMKILPTRDRDGLPRNNIALNYAAREAGDCFWKAGVEIAKLFYIKIDNRYPELDRKADAKKLKAHSEKMSQAKRILQEKRNDIFECVLPIFMISPRRPGDTDYASADDAAQDFFIKNVFYMLTETYLAWLPEFVAEEEVDTTREVLIGLSQAQSDKLSRQLRNFVFEYRPLKVL